MSSEEQSGVVMTLLRVFAAMLGLHIRHAQKEVGRDVERVIGAIVLLAVGGVLGMLALVLGHLALIHYLTPIIGRLRAVLAVAGGDLFVALVLFLTARRRLKKPMLVETRAMVRRTVATLMD
jgi:hypothetical protein